MNRDTATDPAWHALDAQTVRSRLATPQAGLDHAEAERRRAQFGPNTLPAARTRSWADRLAAQLGNPLVLVLLGACVLVALLGHHADAAVILGAVVLNAGIGLAQEHRAERAIDAVRSLLAPQVAVRREGVRRSIQASELVPGDLVLLEAGDRVSADLRLLAARGLAAVEAALTGESLPVTKNTDPASTDAGIADRSCMLFAGTLIASGSGMGIVVRTGTATELGRISGLVQAGEPVVTPLMRALASFATRLSLGIGLASLLLWPAAVWLSGMPPAEALLAVVALAVAAIPEGMPAIVTIVLALGVRRMAARRALVRSLPAVEALGSVTVICTDKTGTLTRNELAVRRIVLPDREVAVEGTGYGPDGRFTDALSGAPLEPRSLPGLERLLRAGLLASDAELLHRDGQWNAEGDPLEAAILAAATRAGLAPATLRELHPRRDAVPFDAMRAWMASLHHDEDRAFVAVKGAPERVLALCGRLASGDAPLDRSAWLARAETLAAQGARLIAVAERDAPHPHLLEEDHVVQGGFVLLGLLALADPPRQSATDAVAMCRRAGIEVKMITGDHPATAAAIAAEVGLARTAKPLTGHAIASLDDADLAAAARATDVFARVEPAQKLRLVQALQAGGAVVAMTGDGVNDAPALKRADIGVAMGRGGTEAAKEASAIVLADDEFATIAAAVQEGRVVADNLAKAIAYILPTNAGEAAMVATALLTGTVLPISPLHVLWINLVTEVTLSIALAFEPAEGDVMARAPARPGQALLSPALLLRTLLVGALMVGAGYGLFLWVRAEGGSLDLARTAALNAIVACEIAYLFNVRLHARSSLSLDALRGNPVIWVSIAALVVLQGLLLHAPPLQRLFATQPLDAAIWAWIVLAAALLFLVVEAAKALERRRTLNPRTARPEPLRPPS